MEIRAIGPEGLEAVRALDHRNSPVIRRSASPGGVPAYLCLGLTAAGGQQERDGILYTPMEFVRPAPPSRG